MLFGGLACQAIGQGGVDTSSCACAGVYGDKGGPGVWRRLCKRAAGAGAVPVHTTVSCSGPLIYQGRSGRVGWVSGQGQLVRVSWLGWPVAGQESSMVQL